MPHNPAPFGSYMVASGSWNLLAQSMLPELFQCTTCLGTAFLMAADVRKDQRSYILVSEPVDQVFAITHSLHNKNNFWRPDIEAGHPFSANRLTGADLVDFFQSGFHRETVCLLSKLHSDQHIEVELQMDELDLTAAESKATYEEIKDYVLEHTGLKVSSLYIAQVKEKCGIIERVNYNVPKSENSRQPKCPPEKEAAIREALEHFRMI